MHPTIDYRIPPIEKKTFLCSDLINYFVFTSVLIDKRLFKSCIRYSGEGGGGNDGLNSKNETIEFQNRKFLYLPKWSHMLWSNEEKKKTIFMFRFNQLFCLYFCSH